MAGYFSSQAFLKKKMTGIDPFLFCDFPPFLISIFVYFNLREANDRIFPLLQIWSARTGHEDLGEGIDLLDDHKGKFI